MWYTIHNPQAGRKEPFPMKLKSLLMFLALALTLLLCATAAADGAVAAHMAAAYLEAVK